jgi:hypothetical protein
VTHLTFALVRNTGEENNRGKSGRWVRTKVTEDLMKHRTGPLRRPSIHTVGTNIRSFLRWLHARGQTTHDLSPTVIVPTLYACESIPSALRSQDHRANQFANFLRNRRPPRLAMSKSSTSRKGENPCGCQPRTVEAFIMKTPDCQSCQTLLSHAHKSRSAGVSFDRFTQR